MKRVLVVFVVMCCLMVKNPGVFAQTIVIATDTTPGGDFIRGGGKTFDKDLPGIEIELYRKAAELLGFELEIRRLPWKLCLQKLEHNQVDGIFPASFKKSRMQIGRYPMADGGVDMSRKTRDNAYFLYTLDGSTLSWDGEAFSGQSGVVGVPLGWAIVEDMKKKGVPLKEVAVHEGTPGLLVQKKLQGFICLETVFDAYLKNDPVAYSKIHKNYPPIWQKPYYLMLSHGFVQTNPEVSEKIWDKIRELKNSHYYEGLVMKYAERKS